MNQHPPAVTWPAYLDGALGPSQQKEIERHLADCPACRADLEAQRALRGRLGNLAPDSSAHASSAATERAWAAVRPRVNARRSPLFRPLRRLAFGLGATALLALFVLSLWALFVQQAGPVWTAEPALGVASRPSPTLASTVAFTLTVNQNVAYEADYGGAGGDLVPVRFTVELYNDGPGVAAQVRLTATLPALLTYLERSASGDAIYDAGTHTVTWAGSLAPRAAHTLSFACGVPQSVGGLGTTATSRVVIDDGVHAPLTDTLTVNFTPWPTIVATPGPPPTFTPWVTPTPSDTFTPGPSSATPTPWSGILTPSSSSATRTPWLTPTSGAVPTATPTPPVPLPPTLPPTPTPLFTPTLGPPPSATPTPSGPPTNTPTPWITPTPGPPSPTPTPWLTPTVGNPLTPTSTPIPPPPATPTPWETPTPSPS
jgi:uncharacterized repeat protein (TIGR01451 family)